uniref:Ion_trans domain-containing protein n=1 Tax=Rodentolepis nana TaxID=102285 RepID=A0A0R3TXW3_RODNA
MGVGGVTNQRTHLADQLDLALRKLCTAFEAMESDPKKSDDFRKLEILLIELSIIGSSVDLLLDDFPRPIEGRVKLWIVRAFWPKGMSDVFVEDVALLTYGLMGFSIFKLDPIAGLFVELSGVYFSMR